MASFTVDSGAVMYDGCLLYARTAAYSVKDTYHNYQKSLLDVADNLITITVAFTNTVASANDTLLMGNVAAVASADAADAAGAAPTSEEFAVVVDLVNELKDQVNLLLTALANGKYMEEES